MIWPLENDLLWVFSTMRVSKKPPVVYPWPQHLVQQAHHGFERQLYGNSGGVTTHSQSNGKGKYKRKERDNRKALRSLWIQIAVVIPRSYYHWSTGPLAFLIFIREAVRCFYAFSHSDSRFQRLNSSLLGRCYHKQHLQASLLKLVNTCLF